MDGRRFFFAGGGTGGHIYPAIAIAEKIIKLDTTAKVHFFCSARNIDSQILSKTDFKYTQLPAKGFSARPNKLISFCSSFLKSSGIAKKMLAETKNAVVIGVGGFVAAPVCWAATVTADAANAEATHVTRTHSSVPGWVDLTGVFVGCDSGLSHLAGALGTPVVALFGPTDPAVWAPRGSRVRVVVGDDRSIEGISVESVCHAVMDALPPRGPAD